MKSFLIACAIAACAVGAGACDGGGGPATPPSDPFTGSEPAGGDSDSVGVGGSLTELCARACAHIDASCPGGASGGPGCASDCASGVAQAPNCESQYRAFVACVATATLMCTGSGIQPQACDAALNAVGTCAGQPTTGGSASGGSATAGGSGTAAP